LCRDNKNFSVMRTKFTIKRLMLPHYFQKIGFSVIVFMFAVILVGMICYWAGGFEPTSRSYPFFSALIGLYSIPWVGTVLRIATIVSIAFITFSREKVEDEMMDRLRLGTVAAVAGAYLVLYIIVSLVWSFGLSDAMAHYIKSNGYEFGFYLRVEQLWMIYVVVFKLRVMAGNRLSDEK